MASMADSTFFQRVNLTLLTLLFIFSESIQNKNSVKTKKEITDNHIGIASG